MTNAKEYYAQVSKFERLGRAEFEKTATAEEIAARDYEESPEGRAAEYERNRANIAARDAQALADRIAAKKAKRQRRREREEAKAAAAQ